MNNEYGQNKNEENELSLHSAPQQTRMKYVIMYVRVSFKKVGQVRVA